MDETKKEVLVSIRLIYLPPPLEFLLDFYFVAVQVKKRG